MSKGFDVLMTSFRQQKKPTDTDYQQAKADGYMFDPVELTHNEVLQRLRCVVEKISPKDVADAFLYSLSTRQLQYRSALGSYYYAISIPEHEPDSDHHCTFCGYYPMCNTPNASEPLDWKRQSPDELEFTGYNLFNYARYKWGGEGFHTDPQYALFDLEQFLCLPKVVPTETDRDILRNILYSMRELVPCQKAGSYQKLITKKRLLKSNAIEVKTLLNILGICGVLSSPEAPCCYDRFVDEWDRKPKESRSYYEYPVNRWQAWDGANEGCFEKVFGFPLRLYANMPVKTFEETQLIEKEERF